MSQVYISCKDPLNLFINEHAYKYYIYLYGVGGKKYGHVVFWDER